LQRQNATPRALFFRRRACLLLSPCHAPFNSLLQQLTTPGRNGVKGGHYLAAATFYSEGPEVTRHGGRFDFRPVDDLHVAGRKPEREKLNAKRGKDDVGMACAMNNKPETKGGGQKCWQRPPGGIEDCSFIPGAAHRRDRREKNKAGQAKNHHASRQESHRLAGTGEAQFLFRTGKLARAAWQQSAGKSLECSHAALVKRRI